MAFRDWETERCARVSDPAPGWTDRSPNCRGHTVGRFGLPVGFWKPLLPFNPPKRYWNLHQRDQIAPPANPLPPDDVPQAIV
jgi:hypothetical protein